MKISEFVDKHGEELGVNYNSIHRLIKSGFLRENIHYRKTYRGAYEKYTVIEMGLLKYLKNGGKNGKDL